MSEDSLPTASPRLPIPHLVALDGLRAAACLAVLSHHCVFHAGHYRFAISPVLNYGYLGVELFFVLSGFCLTYSYFLKDGQPFSLRQYFTKRAWRILPAYWSALLLFGLIRFGIQSFHLAPWVNSNPLGSPTFKQWLYALTLISIIFNTSFWTLTVEARWYLILPGLLRLRRTTGSAGLLALSLLIGALFYLIQNRLPVSTRFLLGTLPLFLPLFAGGICLAEMYAKGKITSRSAPIAWIGLTLSILLIARFTPATPDFEPHRILPAGLFSLSLLLLSLSDRRVNSFFRLPLLAGIGAVSYSLYLIHLPLIHLAYCLVEPFHWRPGFQFAFWQGLFLPLCVVLGWLFSLAAEKPFLRKKTPLFDRAVIHRS